MKRKILLTLVQKENLKKDYLASLSLAELSEKYKIDISTICKTLRYMGIEPTGTQRNRKHDHEKIQKIIKEHGNTPIKAADLAQKCGITAPYLYAFAKRYSIQLPIQNMYRKKEVSITNTAEHVSVTPPVAASIPAPEIPSIVLVLYKNQLPQEPYPQNTLCHVINDGFFSTNIRKSTCACLAKNGFGTTRTKEKILLFLLRTMALGYVYSRAIAQ